MLYYYGFRSLMQYIKVPCYYLHLASFSSIQFTIYIFLSLYYGPLRKIASYSHNKAIKWRSDCFHLTCFLFYTHTHSHKYTEQKAFTLHFAFFPILFVTAPNFNTLFFFLSLQQRNKLNTSINKTICVQEHSSRQLAIYFSQHPR